MDLIHDSANDVRPGKEQSEPAYALTPFFASKKQKLPLNTVFYGPPGVGKTFETINRALKILGVEQPDNYANQYAFRQLLGNHIEFVSFHENYTYDDFVEGIKPEVNRQTGGLIYAQRDGVFKRIAFRALDNFRRGTDVQFLKRERAFSYGITQLLNPLRNDKTEEVPITSGNQVFYLSGYNPVSIKARYGKIGVPTDLSIQVLRQLFIESRKFHELFIGYEPNPYYDAVISKITELEASMPNEDLPPPPVTPYILIIDEINRAPVSKVFGELLTLIDEDKRYGTPNFLTATLPVSGLEFGVPANLFIIATMNRTEKNLYPIETAFRRRFEFEYINPKSELVHEPYQEIFKNLNNALLLLKGPDYQLGHSFFQSSQSSLENIMNLKVIPLLYEYFNSDNDAVRKILETLGIRYELKYGIWHAV